MGISRGSWKTEVAERGRALAADMSVVLVGTCWAAEIEAQMAAQVGMGKFAACCALDVRMLLLERMSADQEYGVRC